MTHKVSCARQSVGRRNRTYQRRDGQYAEPFRADKRPFVVLAIELDDKGDGSGRLAGSVSRLVRSKPTQQGRAACPPLPSGPVGRKELVDGFFLDGAVAIPHDIETLDGSGQALAVQGVARDFLGLAMVGRLVDG